MMRAYHFVADTLRDGRPIPPDGEWLEEPGSLEICVKGLHASKHVSDALEFAPGATLCLVELDGDILEQPDKVCARRRKIIARFDATELLRADARASALSVLHLWKDRVPEVLLRYLQTGDKTLRSAAQSAAWSAAESAARSAAEFAARCAARSAARSAAESAAWSAARFAARDRLQTAVDAKFKELGI